MYYHFIPSIDTKTELPNSLLDKSDQVFTLIIPSLIRNSKKAVSSGWKRKEKLAKIIRKKLEKIL